MMRTSWCLRGLLLAAAVAAQPSWAADETALLASGGSVAVAYGQVEGGQTDREEMAGVRAAFEYENKNVLGLLSGEYHGGTNRASDIRLVAGAGVRYVKAGVAMIARSGRIDTRPGSGFVDTSYDTTGYGLYLRVRPIDTGRASLVIDGHALHYNAGESVYYPESAGVVTSTLDVGDGFGLRAAAYVALPWDPDFGISFEYQVERVDFEPGTLSAAKLVDTTLRLRKAYLSYIWRMM